MCRRLSWGGESRLGYEILLNNGMFGFVKPANDALPAQASHIESPFNELIQRLGGFRAIGALRHLDILRQGRVLMAEVVRNLTGAQTSRVETGGEGLAEAMSCHALMAQSIASFSPVARGVPRTTDVAENGRKYEILRVWLLVLGSADQHLRHRSRH